MATEEEDLQRIFFLECEELVASAEQSVETLRAGGTQDDAINALFRAVHSIKGGAGAFGLDRLAKFAHAFESFMDLLRKGRATLDAAAIDLLFDGVDVLRMLVDEAQNGTQAPPQRYDAAFSALRKAAGLETGPADSAPEPAAPDPTAGIEFEAPAAAALRQYRIVLAPGPRMLAAGVDPLRVIANLKALGSVSVEIDASDLPALEALDPAVCHLRWTIALETSAPRDDVDEIAGMIDDLADVAIEDLTPPEPEAPPEPVVPTAEAATAEAATAAAAPVAAPAAGAPVPDTRREKPVATVRVDVPKLERLGNMVGELIITPAFLARQASDLDTEKHRRLFRALDEMSQHIRDLADAATSIRAQPLKVVFSRFGALVRDLEKSTGKRIRLEVSGEGTEIDKTVVERLSEPLTHLIRNSVDHGIESAEKRLAAGKDPVGLLKLSAEQRGTHVAIELSDDGAGVNRPRVLAKAIERGLVSPGANLSDQEIDDLLFVPGFSTAEAVTSVSGRGVGMDAVRATIAEMGGQVGLVSRTGLGTTFSLHLPLSLAILDAMVTLVGLHSYLIPTSAIIESLRPAASALVRMDGQNTLLAWRGSMLRILSLGAEFSVPGAMDDPTRGILVIVKPAGGELIALQVDDLIGQEPVVVKSLERNYRKVRGISGATILGDGRPALILDLPALGAVMARRPRAEAGTNAG
ncbi:MAG: chemotaxis protein CheA [Rhodospirillales bacterium]|nr:chemotaxis protein CheA [Rhodospirillales bacterium]